MSHLHGLLLVLATNATCLWKTGARSVRPQDSARVAEPKTSGRSVHSCTFTVNCSRMARSCVSASNEHALPCGQGIRFSLRGIHGTHGTRIRQQTHRSDRARGKSRDRDQQVHRRVHRGELGDGERRHPLARRHHERAAAALRHEARRCAARHAPSVRDRARGVFLGLHRRAHGFRARRARVVLPGLFAPARTARARPFRGDLYRARDLVRVRRDFVGRRSPAHAREQGPVRLLRGDPAQQGSERLHRAARRQHGAARTPRRARGNDRGADDRTLRIRRLGIDRDRRAPLRDLVPARNARRKPC